MKTILCALLVLFLCEISDAREFRDFTNSDGVTIHAELLDLVEGKVHYDDFAVKAAPDSGAADGETSE